MLLSKKIIEDDWLDKHLHWILATCISDNILFCMVHKHISHYHLPIYIIHIKVLYEDISISIHVPNNILVYLLLFMKFLIKLSFKLNPLWLYQSSVNSFIKSLHIILLSLVKLLNNHVLDWFYKLFHIFSKFMFYVHKFINEPWFILNCL